MHVDLGDELLARPPRVHADRHAEESASASPLE
jgi:hypothetical protein